MNNSEHQINSLSKLLIPVIALGFYSLIFSLISKRYLPLGVNYFFTDTLWKLSIIIFIPIGLWLIYFSHRSRIHQSLDYKLSKIPLMNALIVLMPLIPVVQYVIKNQDILSIMDGLLVIGFFLFLSISIILIIPFIAGINNSQRSLMLSGTAFLFVIISMALLSSHFSWFEKGNFVIQVSFFIGVLLALFSLDKIRQGKLLSLVIVIMFVSNSLFQIITNWTKATPLHSENDLVKLTSKKEPYFQPNVYLLVYDSYVPNETMIGYGIDNVEQENWLTGKGFHLYSNIYSIGSSTIGTMSRVLDVTDDLTGNKRRPVSGNGAVQYILKNLGYETYGIFVSDFMFRGIKSSYDFSIPRLAKTQSRLLITAILIGEFRFDIGFDEQTHDEFIAEKGEIFKEISQKKVFVYSHTNLPGHSQNSGHCRDNEIEIFAEKLARANTEMKQDIQTIMSNDPNSIIIVAGDHGPYLTKNCFMTGDSYDISEISRLDIQDRFGTFLAIKYPDESLSEFDDITILQDLFPSIFAYIYQDKSILDARLRPVISAQPLISGASVNNGVINGGINDGEPLFIGGE